MNYGAEKASPKQKARFLSRRTSVLARILGIRNQPKIVLRPVEQLFFSFFGKVLAYLMIFQSAAVHLACTSI